MDDYIKLSEPTKRNIGGITFVITAYGSSKSKKTANDLIMQMLEAKVKYPNRKEENLCES